MGTPSIEMLKALTPLDLYFNSNSEMSLADKIKIFIDLAWIIYGSHKDGKYFGKIHPEQIFIGPNNSVYLQGPNSEKEKQLTVFEPPIKIKNANGICNCEENKANDLWGLGCVIYSCFAKEEPWEGIVAKMTLSFDMNLKFIFEKGVPMDFPFNKLIRTTAELEPIFDLLRKCMVYNYTQRLSVEELIKGLVNYRNTLITN